MNAKDILIEAMVKAGFGEYTSMLPGVHEFIRPAEKGITSPKDLLRQSFIWANHERGQEFWRRIHDSLPESVGTIESPGSGRVAERDQAEVMMINLFEKRGGLAEAKAIRDLRANRGMIERDCAAMPVSVSEFGDKPAPARLSPWDYYPDMEHKVSPLWGARLERDTGK